jgi:monofunctional biosynthetic peptidoglycan transglycosylase
MKHAVGGFRSDIAPVVPQTAVMSEDAAFCSHWGVDLGAMREAVRHLARLAGNLRGASTVSMQTAKNLFLWPDRSLVRKAIEVPLAAYYMDLVWSKRRMMEIYLNIVEWDEGVYGIGAAATASFRPHAPQADTAAGGACWSRPCRCRASAIPPGPSSPACPRVARVIERRAQRCGIRWTGCLFDGGAQHERAHAPNSH